MKLEQYISVPQAFQISVMLHRQHLTPGIYGQKTCKRRSTGSYHSVRNPHMSHSQGFTVLDDDLRLIHR